ncbi:hypothetical protein B5J92_07855 [Moraxella atlantae]|nr:hypothetical protein B5J92_07855 [Moraxella atlantae]
MLLADGLIQKDFDALAQACQNMRLNFFLSYCLLSWRRRLILILSAYHIYLKRFDGLRDVTRF